MKVNSVSGNYSNSFGNLKKIVWVMPTAKRVSEVSKYFNTAESYASNKITMFFKNNRLSGFLKEKNNGEFRGFWRGKRYSFEFATIPSFPSSQKLKIDDNKKFWHFIKEVDSYKKGKPYIPTQREIADLVRIRKSEFTTLR